jgi:putative DNA methylase
VKSLFDHIEAEVKPQIQPFYTTTCPRGHQGSWIDVQSGEPITIDPMELPPEQRASYRWDGPEVIYTFWAKHGPCQATGCGHRTPIFKNPVIAEKKLTAYYIPMKCPSCGHSFNAELGETRMSPSTERVVLDNEPSFTELSQAFARHLKRYSQGTGIEKRERALSLLEMLPDEHGLKCPQCGGFSGNKVKAVLDRHANAGRASDLKKKDLGIESRHVYMYLLINPKWLTGASGFEHGNEMGGYAGASVETTTLWHERRLSDLRLIEVRGRIRLADEEIFELDEEDVVESENSDEGDEEEKDRKKYGLPKEIILADGTAIETRKGTVPCKAHFTCGSCGLGGKDKNSEKNNNTLEAVRQTGHTAPVAAYALQCYCPQCDAERYNYGGRYFKALDARDIQRLVAAETEWAKRHQGDLGDYCPGAEIWVSYMTHKLNGGIANWGYTHWWKMFNARQLLVHTQLLKTITEASEEDWPLDVREQTLGAFQQYLRNQNMFSFYHVKRDCLAPALSNSNFHPKNATIEVSAYSDGYGPWKTTSAGILDGLKWAVRPWDSVMKREAGQTKSIRAEMDDPIIPGSESYCASSTDLAMLDDQVFDLVITDPPFGNNLFYADLADFFYVWLRIPLLKWYAGLPEYAYFEPERTPHSMEAIDNSVEHPDDREDYEKSPFIEAKHLIGIQKLSSDNSLSEKDPNPFFRPQPSSDFYSQTLSTCWTEAGRRLKASGIMAFTFHHNEDHAWIDVLKALFDAGYVLVATYPIRSDETKGETGAFGSRKIEYDIIHVCRKRLEEPEPVSWARMRRWVKEEAKHLKELLEHTHGKELPESDLRVILRGKSLEFYSRHYGQVYTGDGQILEVRDALLGINQLLDDLLEDTGMTGGVHPPDIAEPTSRLYLRLFRSRTEMERDELHKTLRGTGISQGDLEVRGWVRVVGKAVTVVPIAERFAWFTERGRNRKVIKTDLDQAHFLIGTALPGSGIKIENELNNPNFRIKKSVDEILKWYAETGVRGQEPGGSVKSETNSDSPLLPLYPSAFSISTAAKTALQLVDHWRTRKDRPELIQPTLFDLLEEGA